MSRHTTHRTVENKRLESNTKIIEILRTVPYEKGFYFYIAPGNFTRETATSLDAFEKKLQVVPADSVNFHLQRGDFQKWIKDTMGDDELAKRVSLIKLTLPVEDLRKELLAIVQTRITELRRELPHHLRHTHS
jgi:alpha-amylase